MSTHLKQLRRASLFVAAIFMLPVMSRAAEINVELVPSKLKPTKGEQITVAINVDLSASQEKLGAISATLTWNTAVLRYVEHAGKQTEGFAKPIVNDQKAAEGRLVFAAIHPYGSEKIVNVLDVKFEVIGATGASPELQTEIKELVAARTFVDLKPRLASALVTTAKDFGIVAIPTEYALRQNYPNPFNAGTEIRYDLPEAGHVSLAIYNTLGAKVKTLIDSAVEAGEHKVNWNGTDDNGNVIATGIYFYRMKAGDFTAVRRMLFTK